MSISSDFLFSEVQVYFLFRQCPHRFVELTWYLLLNYKNTLFHEGAVKARVSLKLAARDSVHWKTSYLDAESQSPGAMCAWHKTTDVNIFQWNRLTDQICTTAMSEWVNNVYAISVYHHCLCYECNVANWLNYKRPLGFFDARKDVKGWQLLIH